MRKPREPRANGKTGGTMRWNSHEVNKTVPSPPSVTTKSKRCGLELHMSAVQYRSCPCSLGLVVSSFPFEDEDEELAELHELLRYGNDANNSGWSRSMPAASNLLDFRS